MDSATGDAVQVQKCVLLRMGALRPPSTAVTKAAYLYGTYTILCYLLGAMVTATFNCGDAVKCEREGSVRVMTDQLSTRVGVFVRCRPLTSRERLGRRCITISGDTIQLGEKNFTFENVFDEIASQEVIYAKCARHLVDGCFQGFNGTIFAYGQTGSGKTHSIMGTAGTEDEEGVIPRAIRDIFYTIHTVKAPVLASYNVRVSMLEIYNDDVRDLLHPDIPSRDIAIREDKDGRIFFTGAREEAVQDVRTALFYLEQGNLNRSTAETLMNTSSSRSHAVFTISIELLEMKEPTDLPAADRSQQRSQQPQEGSYVQAKLHMVDLAGSERAKRTGALGTRLKESVGINQGLLSLGKVIRALTSQAGQHVPYRESKLTRFLQDSLGGNSRTVMLACVSSAESNLHETLGTLQYAQRAKAVQNRVTANVSVGLIPTVNAAQGSEFQTEMESSIIQSLRAQISQMQEEMGAVKLSGQLLGLPMPAMGAGGQGALARGGAGDGAALAGVREELDTVSRSMQRVLRVNGRIQQTLRDHLRHLETSGAHTPQACGPAWGLVNVCDTVVRTLEELQVQHASINGTALRASTMAMRSSMRDSLTNLSALKAAGNLSGAAAVADLTEEVATLRQELEECREDLQRDEEIFAEKVRELKRSRKRIRELEAENKALTEKNETAQAQIQKLATNLLHLQRRPAAVPQGDADPEVDDLDISVAVAVTEPDISQLMEDLETIVREKDNLLQDNKEAEERVASATTTAEKQKEEFVRGQKVLKERLHRLEESIREKERVIGELSAAQDAVLREADAHQRRVRDVEEESRRLRDQLERIHTARQLTEEEASEERQRRREYEAKLRAAEDKLLTMDREHQAFLRAERERIHSEEKSTYEAKQAAEHLRELETFKAEYARLTAQIEHAESKQRKTLDQMAHQISQYQKKAADAQAQIRQLEDKNVELRNRLDRYAKAKRRNGYDDPSSDVSMEADAKHADGRRGGTSSRGREAKGRGAAAKAKSEGVRQVTAQEVSTWLRARLEEVVEGRTAVVEHQRLLSVLAHLEKERAAVQAELLPLQEKQDEAAIRLRAKVTELTHRARALQERRVVVRRRIETGGEDADQLREQLEEIEESLASCDEQRADLSRRLDRGALDDSLLNQLQDLVEELETLDTEAELNQARLAHENLRIAKLSGTQHAAQGTGSVALPQSVAVSGEAIWRDFKHELLADSEDAAGSEGTQHLLVQVIQMVLEHRLESADGAALTKHLQQQLDDKTAECEEAVRAMQKTRTESLRRLEQQRREAEDKIAFLLTQLRAAEARRAQEDHSGASVGSSRPQSRANTGIGPHQGLGATTGPTGGGGGGGSRPNTAGSSADPRLAGQGLRLSGTFLRAPSDAQLSELARQDPSGVHKELERRWLAEKERRERLEKRTTDMAKTIRQLQEKVTSTGGGPVT